MKLLSRGIRIAHLAVLVLAAALPVHGEDIHRLLDEAIQREIARLAPDSLKLPEPAVEPVPPPAVQAAGKDFIHAWRTWVLIMGVPPAASEMKTPTARKDMINAAEEWPQFHTLLTRCMEPHAPPELSEFNRFTYNDHSFCADGFMSFSRRLQKGLTLVMLRRGKFFEALQRFSIHGGLPDPLLRAYGVDPEEYRIGAWLDRKSSPDVLCEKGGEFTARMLMDWIDLRWELELERYRNAKATRDHKDYSEPRFPAFYIIKLLRSDRRVTEETKARISKFMETRCVEMDYLRTWISQCPQGAEKWLVGLAKQGLTNELNEVRQRSSRLLARAGIEHTPPQMRPAPRFTATVDGEPWPGKFSRSTRNQTRLSLSLHSVSGSSFGPDLSLGSDGFYSADPDRFRENGLLDRAEIDISAGSSDDGPVSPERQWLHADVRLPISFSEVNRIEFKTISFTLRPTFSGPIPPDGGDIYEVEFDRASSDKNQPAPSFGRSRLQITGWNPVVLPNVSPGDYWIRIYHTAAVLEPRKRVTVSAKQRSYAPLLQRGACLVIPVDWPELKDPEDSLPYIARNITLGGPDRSASLRTILVLKRKDGTVIREFDRLKRPDGSEMNDTTRIPVAARGKFPNAAIFPCLPPGEYVVESPNRTIEPIGVSPGCEFKQSSVTVIIRPDSPAFVVSAPLKIHYTRKE